MVTGLQSCNTYPASGFSVSFNEETSPNYTEWERQRVGKFCSLIFIFYYSYFCIDCESVICLKTNTKRKENDYSRSRGAAGALAVPKSKWNPESKIYSQQLKINWIYFLLLNLLTACHSINSCNVLLCDGLPQGLKLKPGLLLQIFPQQTLGNVMCGNILLLYLLRKTPRGRCILLMLTLAPC